MHIICSEGVVRQYESLTYNYTHYFGMSVTVAVLAVLSLHREKREIRDSLETPDQRESKENLANQ